MKKMSMIIAGVIAFISCRKDINDVHEIEISSLDNLVSTDSIIFSKNIRPKGFQKFDSTTHKLIADSFYTNTAIIPQRVTLTVNDAGSYTERVSIWIDHIVRQRIARETRYQYYTRYFDFYKINDTIYPGWHDLMFKGTSYPMYDSLNIYYSVYQNDFECYNLKHELVKVYGLPIIKRKKHQ